MTAPATDHPANAPADPARRIEYLPVDEVPGATRNAKAHDLDGVRGSITRFGFTAPLILDERTGRLVAGHGRLEAVQSLLARGADVPDGIRDDGTTWRIPVVRGWASSDDAHADALIIADNKLTEAGGWDDRLLAEVLEDVADYSPDLLAATGYTQRDLDQLIEAAGGDTGDGGIGADPDAVPDTDAGPPVSETGDVWTLAGHRLAVGSCTDAGLVAQLMGGARANCMWTDPPYGVDYVGGDTTTSQAERRAAGGKDLSGDATGAGAAALLADALRVAADHALREGAPAYIAHASGALSITFGQVILDAGWALRQQLLWVKDRIVPGRSDYHYRHEPIWYAFTPSKGGQGRLGRGGDRWYGDDAQSTVFEVKRPARSDLHPTMKPVDLVAAQLRNSCPRGGMVYDPFAGSGTTLIAAQASGITARVCEVDPRYADVILRRWAGLTGQTPVRDRDGATIDADAARDALNDTAQDPA